MTRDEERTALLSDAPDSYLSTDEQPDGLPEDVEDGSAQQETRPGLAVWTVIPVLLIGIFIANSDASLVVASSQQISSEFDALSNASWIITSFILAQCATQSLYGKLSDIFGRKVTLTFANALFIVGCFICGIAQEYWHVLAGRALSGIGCAGMTALVSVIVTDIVPVRSIASWRSYVNIVATVGRSIGGPAGGWLTDTVGWRWSFYGQCPPTLLGLILIIWKLPTKTNASQDLEEEMLLSQKVKRVDVIGAVTLASLISTFLLTTDSIVKDSPWQYTLGMSILTLLFMILFYIVEQYYAKEPILPFSIITKRAALTSYLLMGAQITAQFTLFCSVPVYFQIIGTSAASGGARLIPTIVGNALGGLLSGYIIAKTGRYKLLSMAASMTATVGYLLVCIRWKGTTPWYEVLYIILGGFGMGVVTSTTYVHLAASLEASEMAIAGTMLYLAQAVFSLLGLQLATTVSQAALKIKLSIGLNGVPQKDEIIKQALRSIAYIQKAPFEIRSIIIKSYVDSLTYTFAISTAMGFVAFLIASSMQERRIPS